MNQDLLTQLEAERPTDKGARRLRWFMSGQCALVLALVGLVACGDADDTTRATGTVELTETDVAPLSSGRVLRVLVDEGAVVHTGDTLVVLSQSALPPEIEAGRARVSMAESELRDLRAGARAPELERARADLAAAVANATNARREATRLRTLQQSGGVAVIQVDAAETVAKVAEERVVTARESVRLLEAGARPERLRAAEGAVQQSRAQLASLTARAGELVLVAPHAGVVLGRHVEPGEAIAAGVPAVSLGDPRAPWVRVFVAPAAFETLALGDAAMVRTPGGAGATYPATVVALSPRAEFTPRVAMTETERADLLFGVKLSVSDTTGRLKAGLPVTVTFARDSVR
ncbi:MAG: HlyD family efflux transporter periplasmic adaptor subunit [Gemmatimonadaceae bacterium]|nr:HlyD family efflux transporter periplasmic adaptor subunit [Gemmatimonadaceae bacterium]